MNQVNLVGRVVREAKLQHTGNGKAFMFLTIAVDGYYDKKEKQTTSNFIPLTIWGKEAEKCKNLLKGSLVRVTGRLSDGKFTDKQTGEIKYTLDVIADEVQFLSKPKGGQ